LGGNRHGELRTYINLMITMLLGGLWHGASWTFVAWGGLHGAYLAVERWVRRAPVADGASSSAGVSSRTSRLGMASVGGMASTFLVVTITWVFFRAHTFADAAGMLRSMAGATAATHEVLYWNDIVAVGVIVGAMLATHWRLRATRLESVVAAAPTWTVVLVWTFMAFALVAEQGAGDAFIYFKF
jgi:alginate O-acetyltransferase complex protein AlgI